MPIGLSVCFSRNPRTARVIFMAAPHRGLQRQVYDLVPKGRNEAGLDTPGTWIRHHDKYMKQVGWGERQLEMFRTGIKNIIGRRT